MPTTSFPPAIPLAKAGHAAPSADNSQPWHFWWNGERLGIGYDHKRVDGRTFAADDPATLLAMGAAIENIVAAAEELQIPLDLELFPSQERFPAPCYAAFRFHSEAVCPPLPEQLPLLQRHTNRFPYRKEPLPNTVKRKVEALREEETKIELFQDKESLERIHGLVRMASQIRFQTREVHEWLADCLRFSAEDVKKADGLDVRTLALPPGGDLFLRWIGEWKRMERLNRLGLYTLMARADAAPVAKGPAIGVIKGPKGRESSLAAGRLLVRAWTLLNEAGLAVHPYYVVSDQLHRWSEKKIPERLKTAAGSLVEEARSSFALGKDETLYMLLRIGYPTREAPRSRRLPLEAVFTDLTARR